jgi:hypothetical protein
MTKEEILNTPSGRIHGQVFELEVTDIEWDTDGETIEDCLPTSLNLDIDEFDNDFDFDEELADWLSDKYGFCVEGYSFKWDTVYTD